MWKQPFGLVSKNKSVDLRSIHPMFRALCQDAFVRYNSWTDAENYLLVEKLVSKCEEESWREMAEMVDKSATFEMEAYRCQAIRKYAAYYNLPVESVKAEDVAKSPHGIRGWCEMQVTVPGITSSKGSPDGPPKDPKGKAAAKPKTKRGQAGVDGGDATAATAATAEEGDGDDQPEKPKRGKDKRPKKEQTGLQAAENKSKEILAQLHRSQQIMDKIAMHGDSIPSEWKWAKSFLVEYQGLLASFRDALQPESGGDDIRQFVDDYKLNIIDKSGMKAFRKQYKESYETLLALFVDRCSSFASQLLGKNVNFKYYGRFQPSPSDLFRFLGYVDPSTRSHLLRMDALAQKVHSMSNAAMAGEAAAPKKRARKSK